MKSISFNNVYYNEFRLNQLSIVREGILNLFLDGNKTEKDAKDLYNLNKERLLVFKERSLTEFESNKDLVLISKYLKVNDMVYKEARLVLEILPLNGKLSISDLRNKFLHKEKVRIVDVYKCGEYFYETIFPFLSDEGKKELGTLDSMLFTRNRLIMEEMLKYIE